MENDYEYKFNQENYYRDVVDYYLNHDDHYGVYGMNQRKEEEPTNQNDDDDLDDEGDVILDDYPQYNNDVDKSRDVEDDNPLYVNDSIQYNDANLGALKVQTFTARRTQPVPNATVKVFKENADGTTDVIANVTTDQSGISEVISLPGVPREITETPGLDLRHYFEQYSYNIEVTHPDYIPVLFKNVPIFEGIRSIQNIDLIPKAISNGKDTEEIIDETEPNILGQDSVQQREGE